MQLFLCTSSPSISFLFFWYLFFFFLSYSLGYGTNATKRYLKKKKNDGEYNMEIFESGAMKVNDV